MTITTTEARGGAAVEGGQKRDGGHHNGGPRRRDSGGQACDSGGAAPSILDVEAQLAAAQVLSRRRPLLRQPNDGGHGSRRGDGLLLAR
jgi:hypothetical protein